LCCFDSADSFFCVNSGASFAAGSDLSETAFLKPLTADPKSLPILRNRLVPNSSTTMTNTISNCQILIPPMLLPRYLILARYHKPTTETTVDRAANATNKVGLHATNKIVVLTNNALLTTANAIVLSCCCWLLRINVN